MFECEQIVNFKNTVDKRDYRIVTVYDNEVELVDNETNSNYHRWVSMDEIFFVRVSEKHKNFKHSMLKDLAVTTRYINIVGKANDLCDTTLLNESMTKIYSKDGGVPDFMPNGGGDYIDLLIDITNGQILNWKTISEKKLINFVLNKE